MILARKKREMSERNWEKRAAQRFQVLGHAQLRVGPLAINCVIRDISPSGAKLGLPSAARLPAKADLWLVQGDAKIRVLLKWREGDYVGVAFAGKKAGSLEMASASQKRAVLDV